jgi:hypothetical protein
MMHDLEDEIGQTAAGCLWLYPLCAATILAAAAEVEKCIIPVLL